MKPYLPLALTLLLGVPLQAEVRLPRLFQDGMVLPQARSAPVWGWADPGEKVSVSGSWGKSAEAVAGADGSWQVLLDTPSAGGPYALKVSGENAIELGNVLVGEVWLCSGQSNMAWKVVNSNNAEEELANAAYPEIRHFKVVVDAARTVDRRQSDAEGEWVVCSPQTVGEFSAAGYFFARKLHQELGVPVGLINSSWGGTPIAAWMSREAQVGDERVAPKVARYREELEAYDPAKEEETYQTDLARWEAARARGENPRKPVKGPPRAQMVPGSLYNGMIHPLAPYGISGALWYQGEANAHTVDDAFRYRDDLSKMVAEWRSLWKLPGERFPFFAAQLPNYKKPMAEPVEEGSGWAMIRESFWDTAKSDPNLDIAVIIDSGEEKNIHPTDKQTVGHRLALLALRQVYGKDLVANGPIYSSHRIDGNRVVIEFSDTPSGLVAKGGALTHFAVAGPDRAFVQANARIVGKTVVVSASGVDSPQAVRYAWGDNPVGCNLFNEAGLPASPFRTDDWTPTN